MGWIHPKSWAIYTTIESLQSLNSQKGPPFRLSHIFLLSILSVVPGLWPVFGSFSVPEIYVETYPYDDVYVQLLTRSHVRSSGHIVR